MNLVAMIGNVASEPELRYTHGGKAVCSFRLAISRPKDDDADFFTIVAWERQAEICNEHLTKGRRIGVEGRLHHVTWDTDDGKRSKVEVVAHRIQLLPGARRVTSEQAAEAVAPVEPAPATAVPA